jgi:hypothetical protein
MPSNDQIRKSATARRVAIKNAAKPNASATDRFKARLAETIKSNKDKKIKAKMRAVPKAVPMSMTATSRGCVVNPATGRAIIIGSATYNKLKREGKL